MRMKMMKRNFKLSLLREKANSRKGTIKSVM